MMPDIGLPIVKKVSQGKNKDMSNRIIDRPSSID